MNEKINNRIAGILPKKKKYLILIGIYLLCLVITTVLNPWSIQVTYRQYYGTCTHYWTEYYDPVDSFYTDLVDINAPSQLIKDVPHLRFIARHLLTLGMADFYTVYGFSNEVDVSVVFYSSEISTGYWRFWGTLFFPVIMMLKAFIMKRWFAKEKDRVELGEPKKHRFKLLYYRSENFAAEIVADNIAFIVTGILIRAASELSELRLGPEDQLSGSAGTFFWVMRVLFFLPCSIPYKVMEILVEFYRNFTFGLLWCAPNSGLVPWLLFLIVMPLLSLIAIALLELFLRLVCRLYEMILLALRRISNKRTRLVYKHNQ
ncbi:hypothetical protein [Ruminococcus albus]|uniref:Uncharacterized protein n=1 Tax=Ruminococcus albus TaxID=1264 RepID=A0A1H7HTW2_RUMAL|nr:hypothetical protein [Ruminococcus albus]SEK53731.1 hypothetical protein SAMN05216469_10394 [Ruminococcus albus]